MPSFSTIGLSLLLAALFFAAIRYIYRQHKAGKCVGCDSMPSSGGCASCPCHLSCQSSQDGAGNDSGALDRKTPGGSHFSPRTKPAAHR
ncbi:MAG: hypothetical protein VB085_03680 [Peptococcaceae bacterium]|nr:hypothetical protein [Peptococcaceae bacterium]